MSITVLKHCYDIIHFSRIELLLHKLNNFLDNGIMYVNLGVTSTCQLTFMIHYLYLGFSIIHLEIHHNDRQSKGVDSTYLSVDLNCSFRSVNKKLT